MIESENQKIVVLFRNNTGLGWVGKANRLPSGDILIENPRPLHAGLCTGSSDLIGWMPTLITPDMVGKKIAIFLAVEVKAGTSPSPEQIQFIENIRAAGGIAGIAKKAEDVNKLLSQLSLL